MVPSMEVTALAALYCSETDFHVYLWYPTLPLRFPGLGLSAIDARVFGCTLLNSLFHRCLPRPLNSLNFSILRLNPFVASSSSLLLFFKFLSPTCWLKNLLMVRLRCHAVVCCRSWVARYFKLLGLRGCGEEYFTNAKRTIRRWVAGCRLQLRNAGGENQIPGLLEIFC